MRKLIGVLLMATVLNACNNDIESDVLVANGLPIDGSQQLPPKAVAGTGTVDVTYNRAIKTLYYTVKWNGLTGAPVSSGSVGFGIYGSAAKGFRAPSQIVMFDKFTTAASGTYSGSVFIDGVTLKEADLLQGLYYINIPTAANPVNPANPAANGEIRGQIVGLK